MQDPNQVANTLKEIGSRRGSAVECKLFRHSVRRGRTAGRVLFDARQRLLNPFADVIEELYTACESGSVFDHLYAHQRNTAACLAGGSTC